MYSAYKTQTFQRTEWMACRAHKNNGHIFFQVINEQIKFIELVANRYATLNWLKKPLFLFANAEH